MIEQTIVEQGGRRYLRTASDRFWLERDGEQYREALDPADSGRVYTETRLPLVKTTAEQLAEAREALRILGVQP